MKLLILLLATFFSIGEAEESFGLGFPITRENLMNMKEETQPFASLSDVEYYLYTQKNKILPKTIKNGRVGDLSSSNFDPNTTSIFVVHGWTQSRLSELNTMIREALFESLNVNVFVVDWSSIARKLYTSARAATGPIGVIIGNFINDIQNAYNLDGSSFILIGHSLGAHVVGSAGATTNRKVSHIIGLDPAGPLFNAARPHDCLDPTDGEFVQVIHTNGLLLGYSDSLGHVDYYPNGGMSQPGCGLDTGGICSHMKSYKYLAEAINRRSAFRAVLCTKYLHYIAGACKGNEELFMGDLLVGKSTRGDYFLKTNNRSPFGQG